MYGKQAIDAIEASNIVFWLFLDPCFEWAGSARAHRRGPGGGLGHQPADAQEEAAARDRGAAPAGPRAQPGHRPTDPRLGRG